MNRTPGSRFSAGGASPRLLGASTRAIGRITVSDSRTR